MSCYGYQKDKQKERLLALHDGKQSLSGESVLLHLSEILTPHTFAGKVY